MLRSLPLKKISFLCLILVSLLFYSCSTKKALTTDSKIEKHKNNRLFGKKKPSDFYVFRVVKMENKNSENTQIEDQMLYAMADDPSATSDLTQVAHTSDQQSIIFERPFAVSEPDISKINGVFDSKGKVKSKSDSKKKIKARNQDEKKTHPLAKWGFAASLLGVLTLPLVLFPVILCPVGIFLSIRALKKIRNDPEQYKGKGLARVGLILGITVIALLIAFLITELTTGWGSLSW